MNDRTLDTMPGQDTFRRPYGMHEWGLGLILCALVVLSLWPALTSLLSKWLSWRDAYTHGLLNALLAMWMIVRVLRRQNSAARHTPVVPLGLSLASVALASAYLTNIELLYQLVMPVWLAFLVACIYGGQLLLPLLRATSVLYLAIPFWDYANSALQSLSALVSGFMLGGLGVNATIEGIYVTIDAGIFEVADGCSGLRYLLVSMTLAYLHNALHIRSRQRQLILMVAAICTALVTNWIRVVTIIYAGHSSGMQSDLVQDHELFGWLIYLASLLPLMFFAHRLELADKRASIVQPPARLLPPVRPVTFHRSSAAFALGMVVPLAAILVTLTAQPDKRFPPIELADSSSDWQRILVKPDLYVVPAYSGYTQSLDASYSRVNDPALVSLNLRLYSRQQNRDELISRKNREFSSALWRADLRIPSGREGLNLIRVSHRESGQQFLLAYTYLVGGKLYDDPFKAKLGQLVSLFVERRPDAALIQASSPCNDSCLDASQRLQSFFDAQMPSIRASLEAAFTRSL